MREVTEVPRTYYTLDRPTWPSRSASLFCVQNDTHSAAHGAGFRPSVTAHTC